MRKQMAAVLACVLIFLLALPGGRALAAEDELLEKSGAGELYDGLEGETRELLEEAGVDSPLLGRDFTGEKLLQAISQLLRDRVTGPLKALAALAAAVILCRLAACMEGGGVDGVAEVAGALICAAAVAAPLLELIRRTQRAVESASVFLLSAVPVYGGLMAVSGSPAVGSSYSFLTLAAGNAIPVLASAVVFPALHVFLALALVSAVSREKLGALAGSLYGFVKWLLVLAVTAFSGVLSVQTALNAHVDAATNKAAKLVAATAIPLVGGAFGDGVAAIQNSVGMVKSGVGAFGILAALCIFAPVAVEAVIWSGVCVLGQLMADLLESPKLSGFLKLLCLAAKMILAVIAAVCAVCVVCAAIVLMAGGGS